MKIESKPLRYAHAEGHTDICYSEEGQHVITCGHDGDVRIWADIEDDDPNSHCVGESALAVCFKDKRVYVATDSHAVQAYTFPAFDKDGIVTRFTAPVTQIMSTSKIEALGCTSENMEAKICSPEGGAPLFVMNGHKGPVLSITICPKMKYAATASGDGLLRVWDIDMQKMLKEINCVPKINTFYSAKVLCRMHFEPQEGKYLAYPNNREIIILDCESWSQRMTFTHSTIKCAISQCKFSPCGGYLAGSTVAGQIAVWEVESGECIGVVEHPTSHNVTAMAWNPKGNGVLSYCDVAGQLGTLVNCYGKDSGTKDDENDVEAVERMDDNDDIIENLIENYESEDENAISLEKIRKETMGAASGVGSRGSSPPLTPQPRRRAPQPPLQPAATPRHLEHRYMCYNDVGIVRCHTQENGESTIEVEFHDTSVHHGLHLNNYLNHTMASLSNTVLALACEAPSKLVCISLVGSSKEWSVSMPDVEEVQCIAASSGLVAVATSARLIRLFTPMGTQRQVICLSGPIVALTGFNTTAVAIYHDTDPGDLDQNLAMDIITVNGPSIRSSTSRVPLSAGAVVSWAGVSDLGAPAVTDSRGVLRLYSKDRCWVTVCDTNQHARNPSDTCFVVAVSESSQTVRCVWCRGCSYPPTAPKPVLAELPMQIPLCELDTEKGQYEEQLVKWAVLRTDVEVKTARETALKLFALACRSEIEQRALELMELLKDDRLLPLAAKYASRLGRMHLAEKLSNLNEAWEKDVDLNEAQTIDYHEQDTQGTEASEDMNASLIIPQKTTEKKAETAAIRPIPIKSSPMGVRNPFRKPPTSSPAASSPLSLTHRTLVEQERQENTDPLQPTTGETFMDWFGRNKSILETRHPDLTPAELTKTCIRLFKSLQTTNGDTSASENGLKRKIDETDSEKAPTNTPKQSKLSAFAFSKKT